MKYLAAVLTAFALLCGTAHAQHRAVSESALTSHSTAVAVKRHEPHGWRLTRAEAVASKAWGDPCPTGVSVRRAVIASDRVAESQQDTCAIRIQQNAALSWVDLCTTMVHEYGHLAGFRDPSNIKDPLHSSDPQSVMYGSGEMIDQDDTELNSRDGTYRLERGYDWRCAYHGRPFLGMRFDGMEREVWRSPLR